MLWRPGILPPSSKVIPKHLLLSCTCIRALSVPKFAAFAPVGHSTPGRWGKVLFPALRVLARTRRVMYSWNASTVLPPLTLKEVAHHELKISIESTCNNDRTTSRYCYARTEMVLRSLKVNGDMFTTCASLDERCVLCSKTIWRLAGLVLTIVATYGLVTPSHGPLTTRDLHCAISPKSTPSDSAAA
jgi:hypothetical protein